MRERTILFVDDEEKSRKYFRRIFRGKFEVIEAGDGREGATVFAERREEIGIVVTDQIMPRVTGLDLLRGIANDGPEVIRILSTAYADSELVAEAAETQLIDFFIVKPWDIDGVSAILEDAALQFASERKSEPGDESPITGGVKSVV